MGVVYREGGVIGPSPALSAASSPGRWRVDEIAYRRSLGLWPEQIVTAGLEQHFDAALPECYPGSGTTCNDLSGNARHGTLVNGTGYSSGNGGTFLFDRVNDYISTTYDGPNSLMATNTGAWSVEAWFNFSAPASPTDYYTLVGRGGGTAGAATFLLGIVGTTNVWGGVTLQQNNVATVLRGVGTQITSASISGTGWHQVVITWDASTARSYLDGAFVKNLSVGAAVVQSQIVTIGNTASGGGLGWYNDRISNVKIYSTSLSAVAVLQNFNALRNRYGI